MRGNHSSTAVSMGPVGWRHAEVGRVFVQNRVGLTQMTYGTQTGQHPQGERSSKNKKKKKKD